MAIPSIDFINKPYDDETMFYDLELGQYILDPDYARNETGYNLMAKFGTAENVVTILSFISTFAYNYIYSFKDSAYRKKMRYYLSHSKENREGIKKLMVDLVKYLFQESGPLMSYITGINLQEARSIPLPTKEYTVGINGSIIAENYGFKNRYFKYRFTIDDKYGEEW